MEYDWNEDTGYARAALADYTISGTFGARLRLPLADAVKVESSAGDRSRWEVIWRVEGKSASTQIVRSLAERITASLKTQAEPVSGPSPQRSWRFTDRRKRKWIVRLNAAEAAGVKRVTMTAILAA